MHEIMIAAEASEAPSSAGRSLETTRTHLTRGARPRLTSPSGPPRPRAARRRGGGLRLGWLSLLIAALASAAEVRAGVEAPDAAGAAGFTAADAAELDRYVSGALGAFEVPGAAVAVIEGGKIVYRGTFGVRGLEHPEPVDGQTRFMIGSITKSMTATVVGTLVDDGMLDWDSPVVRWFPSFTLQNAEDPGDVTLRQLLSHSTGTAPNDVALLFDPPDPLGLLDQVATLPTVGVPLGEGFDYHNHLFSLAGYAAARAAGAPLTRRGLQRGYEELLEERLFAPAGMTRATANMSQALHSENHAYPHSGRVLDPAIAPVPIRMERFVTRVAPAGAVWASLDDLARYALLLVREGVAESGARVLSAESLETTQTVQAAFSPFVGYGLGWFIRTFGETPVVEHAGGTAGFSASLWTVPAEGRALAVLTNSKESEPFRAAIQRYVDELTLDLPHAGDADLLAEFQTGYQWAADLLAAVRPVTAAEARELAGHYERDVHVSARGGDLLLHTRYGTHIFRAAIGGEELFLSIDNVDTGTRLSPERDPESGRVTRLIVRAPVLAGRLQSATVLARAEARCDGHSAEDEKRANAASSLATARSEREPERIDDGESE